MDVLDRGLNKVIGVEETSRPKTPQLPQINVAAEVKPRPVENVYYSSSFPLQQPLLPQQQHQWQQQQPPYIANESGKIDFNESLAPIGGFDPFARKNSIEAKLQGVFSPTPPAEETFGFKPPQQHQVPEAMTHPHPTWQPQPPTAPSQYHQQDFGFQPWQQQPSQAPTSHVPLQQQVEFSSQLRFDGTLGQEQQMSDPRPNSPQGMSQPDFSFGWQQPQPSQQSWQGQASAQLSPTKPGPQRLTSPALTHQYSMPNLAASSQQQQYTQDESAKGMHHAPSEDEFGFSNAALTKLKPSPSAEQAKGSDEKEEQTDSDVDSKGSKFGFIWGIFGRKKDTSSPALSAGISGSNGAKQANLGEPGLSLVYDDKLKKWINKETGAPPVAEAAPPPPPSVSSSRISFFVFGAVLIHVSVARGNIGWCSLSSIISKKCGQW